MGEWKNGLFGCFSDMKTCVFAYFVPCFVFGKTAEKIGAGSCIQCALAMYVPILNIWACIKVRGMVREQSGIEGSCCNDFIFKALCPICTLVQEANEVDWNNSGQAMARE